MKKKKILQNSNGISVCDSIVMSVKKKKMNFRRIEGIAIAIMGYVSIIMSFLKMFDFNYNHNTLFFAGLFFSAVYIFLSVSGRKSGWIIIASMIAIVAVAYRAIDTISLGFKYTYNVIYHTSFHTEINYYKFLKPEQEVQCTTAFFIIVIWFIASVLYFFTISHPNPILPLLATFPIIEVGLYNGIELPIFWGVLVIAYWLAVLAMSTIDIGEYTGGNGGFVRKENLFFPKRQMRLKVTEKCGMFIIITVFSIALISSAVIKLSDYKRSDSINQKRIDVKNAVMSFSFENVADSISNITGAFGFTLKYENHKLGNIDRLRYKDVTDLTVTFDRLFNGAVYLKDYSGAVYSDNKWESLPSSKYKNQLFEDFRNYGIYPQDFPYLFNKILKPDEKNRTIQIHSENKTNRTYSPYGTQGSSAFDYTNDTAVSSKKQSEKNYSYVFTPADNMIVKNNNLSDPSRTVYSAESIGNEYWRKAVRNYGSEHGFTDYDGYISIDSEINIPPYLSENIYSTPEIIMAELLENEYKKFVYENYLQVPDTDELKEVKDAYSDILDTSEYNGMSIQLKNMYVLEEIRTKIKEEAEYSLNPGKTPSNRDFVNYFLLENKKGYCTHYATAVVILARMAGIPARYATGYVIVGDDFNEKNRSSDNSYTIDVKDSRSHAWAEVYIDGYGWIPFECTAGYSSQSVAPVTETTTAVTTTIRPETSTTSAEGTLTRPESSSRNSTDTIQKSSSSEKSTVTTYSTQISVPSGSGHKPIHIPESVQKIFRIVFAFMIIVLAVCMRRKYILYVRNRNFRDGKNNDRLAYIYLYAEKLIGELQIYKENLNYSEYAQTAENKLAGKYFESGQFESFVNTALHSSFGLYTPTNDEIKEYRKFVRELSEKIYRDSNRFDRFIMKFFKVLI